MARVAEKNGSFIIYISTDSVFDGKQGNYNENDITNPINYYAQTKLEGEQVLPKYDKPPTFMLPMDLIVAPA